MKGKEHSTSEIWHALSQKARFYGVEFVPSIGENEIALSLSNQTCCYPATTQGMAEAITDIEHASDYGSL